MYMLSLVHFVSDPMHELHLKSQSILFVFHDLQLPYEFVAHISANGRLLADAHGVSAEFVKILCSLHGAALCSVLQQHAKLCFLVQVLNEQLYLVAVLVDLMRRPVPKHAPK